MNNTWKLSVLGGVALVASACVAAAGCTVTTSSGGLDGGDFGNDSGTSDTGTRADGGTADTGTDSGPTCAATVACAIIGPSTRGVNFDPPGTCGTCDTCMATKCCGETTACFTKEADGGLSACETIFDCIATCEAADAGAACNQGCADGNPSGAPAQQALTTCLNDKCSGTDGGVAECQ